MLKIFSYLNNMHKTLCIMCFFFLVTILPFKKLKLLPSNLPIISVLNGIFVQKTQFTHQCSHTHRVPAGRKRLILYPMLLVDQDTSVEILSPEMLANTQKYFRASCVCVSLVTASSADEALKHFVVLHCQQFCLEVANSCNGCPERSVVAVRIKVQNVFERSPRPFPLSCDFL